MKRTLIGLMIALVSPLPALADVIPTAGDASKKRAAVEQSLQERGLAAADARAEAAQLSPADASYFAESPERVQMVGGILFEEWAGAAIAALGVPLATYVLLRAVAIYGD